LAGKNAFAKPVFEKTGYEACKGLRFKTMGGAKPRPV